MLRGRRRRAARAERRACERQARAWRQRFVRDPRVVRRRGALSASEGTSRLVHESRRKSLHFGRPALAHHRKREDAFAASLHARVRCGEGGRQDKERARPRLEARTHGASARAALLRRHWRRLAWRVRRRGLPHGTRGRERVQRNARAQEGGRPRARRFAHVDERGGQHGHSLPRPVGGAARAGRDCRQRRMELGIRDNPQYGGRGGGDTRPPVPCNLRRIFAGEAQSGAFASRAEQRSVPARQTRVAPSHGRLRAVRKRR